MKKSLLPAGLNPEQTKAVACTEGPLLVLAGAGTGKTRVITERIAYLLRNQISPENILAVTFTNKAAGEMKKRLRGIVGRKFKLTSLVMGTFHSLCVRLLRRDATALGYLPAFSIVDQGEQMGLVRKARKNVRGGGTMKPDEMLAEIGKLKNQGISPEQFLRRATEDSEYTLAAIYRRYQEALKRINAMDFDDLILKSLELLEQHPEVRAHWQERFHYILVDEFQDTNHTQYRLVEILSGGHHNLCVVGDDDQSIYGWRGAVADNILNFHRQFKNTTTVRLEENYRSTNTILRAANAVIANNENRSEKNLWSSHGEGDLIRVQTAEGAQEEADLVVTEIKKRLLNGQDQPQNFAVILRMNAQTRPFEDELRAALIPYVIIGGTSFFDHKEVRDIMGFLTVIANPRDDAALLRIMNIPARGIGDKTVERLGKYAAETGGTIGQAMSQAEEVPELTAKARKACLSFSRQIAAWRKQTQDEGAHNLVETLIADSAYEDEIQHLYDDALDRANRLNLAQDVGASLRAYLGREENNGLSGFLQEAALLSKADQTAKEREQAENAVKLITAHSAKGLEFPCVYVVGVEEGILPHKNAEEAGTVDEERRLFYVAITRAEKELTLSYCRERLQRGKAVKRTPSRFLREIPEKLLASREALPSDEDTANAIKEMIARLGGTE